MSVNVDCDGTTRVSSQLSTTHLRDQETIIRAGTSALTLSQGARLGPYEIVGFIGAGGMGEVYEARDPRLDRTVAIKVLPSAISDAADRRARFEREARTIASLA